MTFKPFSHQADDSACTPPQSFARGLRKAAITALGATSLMFGQQAFAQTEMYVGQLFVMGSNFCPRGSLPANGAILNIAQNTTLFSLLGTTYGGNGVNTFGLPDLRGRSPIGVGQGPGLQNFTWGEIAGAETNTLNVNQMPIQTNSIKASTKPATHATPGPDRVPAQTMNAGGYIAASEADTTLAPNTGGSQPFSIRDPYLAMTWCIVTSGIYPPRE